MFCKASTELGVFRAYGDGDGEVNRLTKEASSTHQYLFCLIVVSDWFSLEYSIECLSLVQLQFSVDKRTQRCCWRQG